MHIIKLNAIGSTNTYLRQLNAKAPLKDFTVASAKQQTEGRGQMGTKWQSQSSKNLMLSVFTNVSFLDIDKNFCLSMATSLALLDTLSHFNLRRLFVKWPNDIMADNQKISGILIENIIKKQKIEASIIGIGLNVNQTDFEDLPQATSMKAITGVHYDLDAVLSLMLKNLEKQLDRLKLGNFGSLKNDYEAALFRKNKPSTFEDKQGHRFSGYIKGVTESGLLQILLEDNILKNYDFKKVKLLY